MGRYGIILIILSLFLLPGCSFGREDGSDGQAGLEMEYRLPEGYSLEKIEKAYVEWYNYLAWYYPSEHSEYYDGPVEQSFTVYTGLGQVFIVEKKWDRAFLAYCRLDEAGDIKLDGFYQLVDDSVTASSEEIGNYTVAMPYPYKPEFKDFERKDEVLKAIEEGIRAYCQDYLSRHPAGALEVYVTDFDRDYISRATALVIVDQSKIIVSGIGYEEVDGEYFGGLRGIPPQEMGIEEFDDIKLKRIKESAILHFAVGA